MSADAALVRALLAELAREPEGVSLPRLCKRLGVRMSVLMRTLAWIGEEDAGGVTGTGWVRQVEDGARTLAVLTPTGRELEALLSGSEDAGGEPPGGSQPP